jgi:uncharacterized phage-associated protein
MLYFKKRGVKMVGPLEVANTILNKGFEEGIDISPMKLQKLAYFLYKKYYQETNELLFKEEFEVWKYGPVNNDIYQGFKNYGANHIRDYYKKANTPTMLVDTDKSDDFKKSLNFVWDNYKNYSGRSLSILTHKEGTAWYKAVKNKTYTMTFEDIYVEEWSHQ